MALAIGSRLGPYEILSALGAGGMGEVYRATDTNLGRQVAIKVLPEAFAQDAERLARFEREAKTLASLNHPHIAQIYGLERSTGVQALVMELVEGEDLSHRIARGAIPTDEALPIAKQIAEALEAAHEQGIIHRDLKPANIKLRPDGTVKVLDFGLAKLAESASTGQQAVAGNASLSPTITSPAMMTGVGVLLGTAAYMSPEQARGKTVDRRADIWAFGAVLYEMLTGTRAFEGEDIADTLGNVMKVEPSWDRCPASIPAHVVQVMRACLQKNPRQRIDSAQDVRLALSGAFESPAPVHSVAAHATPASRRRVVSAVSAALLVGATSAALATWALTRPAAARVIRTTIATSAQAALSVIDVDTDLALSPDGTRVVYVGNNGTQLFVRMLDALEPKAVYTGAPRGPFISRDGHWVGFTDAGNMLKKVALTGGPAVTLATLESASRGATWAPDDTIIFATNDSSTGLMRVSAAGGTPEVLTRPDRGHGEADHLFPEILPGGQAVLFTITSLTGGLDAAQVVVHDLRTGTEKVLLRGGSHGHYVASGHLVYVAAGTLLAIPFDPSRLETHGTAVPVLPRLGTTTTGAGDFAVATDGTLVYADVPGSVAPNARTLVWVDRTGKEEPLAAPPRAWQHPRLSPDGTRVAIANDDQENDIWIWNLARATLTRLTFNPGNDWFPVWTPDGRRIIFSSSGRSGSNLSNLWSQAADGTGAAERLTTSSSAQFVNGITPDGTTVIFNEPTSMGRDLLQLQLDGSRHVTPLLETKFDERNGTVSPDGRWLAYESNSSGAFEIYVRPYPNVGAGQWQVSAAGGTKPLWARSGNELFYFGADGALQRVPVEASGATWNAGTPTKLLEARYYQASNSTTGRTYDVSPDGQRFLMIKAPGTDAGAEPPALIVVQHFEEELKRLAPTK